MAACYPLTETHRGHAWFNNGGPINIRRVISNVFPRNGLDFKRYNIKGREVTNGKTFLVHNNYKKYEKNPQAAS